MRKNNVPKPGVRGVTGFDTPYDPSLPPSIVDMILQGVTGGPVGNSISQLLQPGPQGATPMQAPVRPMTQEPSPVDSMPIPAAAAQVPAAQVVGRATAPPMPTFDPYQQQPPLTPIPAAPVRDAAAAQKREQDALMLALSLGALGGVTGHGGHTADYIGAALKGAGVANDRSQKEAVADWQNQLSQVNDTNQRITSGTNSQNEVIRGNNQNKEADYNNRREIYNTDSRTDAMINKANNDRDNAYRKYFTSLDAAGQEGEVLNNPLAAQLGFVERRDTQGNFVPYGTKADAVKQQTANTKQQAVEQAPTIQAGKNATALTVGDRRNATSVKTAGIRATASTDTANINATARKEVAKLMQSGANSRAAAAQGSAMARLVYQQGAMDVRAGEGRKLQRERFKAIYGVDSDHPMAQELIKQTARLNSIESNMTRLADGTKNNPALVTPETQALYKSLSDEHERVIARAQELQQQLLNSRNAQPPAAVGGSGPGGERKIKVGAAGHTLTVLPEK